MQIVDALLEFGIPNEKGIEHFKVLCPFHSDNNPSATVHYKTGRFKCWVCNKSCSFTSYLSRQAGISYAKTRVKLGLRPDCKNPISPADIEKLHEAIWVNSNALEALHYRCIDNDSIRKYKIGVKDIKVGECRITIPILNGVGEYANLRLYLPGASSRKFLNASGIDRSKTRFFPYDQLEFDQILICGGELKALAAAAVLNKHDIGAIAPTCGENSWPSELNDLLKDKLVYVNCDVDATGIKYSELRCRAISGFARAVHKVVLTEAEVGNDPKGDINDFLRLGGDLYSKILNTPEWKLIPGGVVKEEMPVDVGFKEAFSTEYNGHRVRFTAVVTAVNSNTYLIGKKIVVSCARNEDFCTTCDVFSQAFSSDTTMSISPEHPANLRFIGEREEEHHKAYKQCFNIPAACRQCKFNPTELVTAIEARVEEQQLSTTLSTMAQPKTVYIIGATDLDPQSYEITGRLHPAPRTQVGVVIASEYEPTSDALEAYESVALEELDIFKPAEWTVASIEEKLDSIYNDLVCNVTRIYQRNDYHIAVDLTYHSALSIPVTADKNTRGYVETLVVGDTGQGKSDVIDSLRRFYGLGKKLDCKNITLPGLTIGLERGKEKHYSVLGAMPRNDRMLLIFEELKGMHPAIFAALTEVRSSGIAQVTKIESQSRFARVRIIALSNPIRAREVASYAYGIDSVIGVVPAFEDLRRFDLVLVLGKDDIKELPELMDPPSADHIYTNDLCQRCILRAWKCEQVQFEDKNFILTVTKGLVNDFGHGTPVLDGNSSHIKVMRLSAALAARTSSYGPNDVLIVRNCHVQYIEKFLRRVYESPSCKLGAKSRASKAAMELRDREGLIRVLRALPNASDICRKMLETDEFDSFMVRDLCGDAMIGAAMFSKLIQTNALTLSGKKYSKTPSFTQLLSTFTTGKPEYLENAPRVF